MLDREIIRVGCGPVAFERSPYLVIFHLDLPPPLAAPFRHPELNVFRHHPLGFLERVGLVLQRSGGALARSFSSQIVSLESTHSTFRHTDIT